ncbi:thymidine phosphorylase [Pseudomaricurvus alkylphenolicus]|uniref:thymidine phosphorylase n=1 Tax=Pseudomaricurvus alkylphenolicus TaxID=1306991 RepID=UPI00141FF5B0|nr:thymidine phosphorylase [Pseudomaricurvus alkylphenolicus]
MLIQDIICKKRDGGELSAAEIEYFVEGLTNSTISEGQVAAFAMATLFRDMSAMESVALTRAMRDSGDVLQWQSLDLSGPVLDKHSSGGVGDKVSLMLAPMLAACGAYVPMISGRGLGHTGGTLDKLDSIPGYNTTPDSKTFQRVVQQVGCAIVGQTDGLAPADRRFYAIRDVTGTVESLPLITASILSKKLAAGLDALVMDIKTGNGAFARTLQMAEDLAARLVAVGKGLDLPVTALITDMSQILGRTAGNALEVRECIDYLSGEQREARLHQVVMELGVELLISSGLVDKREQAFVRLAEALESGAAAEAFTNMVVALGGPADLLESPDRYLPQAPVQVPVYAQQEGVVNAMDVRRLGNGIVELGGGRHRTEDTIDHRVGLTQVVAIGERVDRDRPLAWIHAANQNDAEQMQACLRAFISVGDPPAEQPQTLLRRIT